MFPLARRAMERICILLLGTIVTEELDVDSTHIVYFIGRKTIDRLTYIHHYKCEY